MCTYMAWLRIVYTVYTYLARWARAICLPAAAGPAPLSGCTTCLAPLPPLRTIVRIVIIVLVHVVVVRMVVHIISVCRPVWGSSV